MCLLVTARRNSAPQRAQHGLEVQPDQVPAFAASLSPSRTPPPLSCACMTTRWATRAGLWMWQPWWHGPCESMHPTLAPPRRTSGSRAAFDSSTRLAQGQHFVVQQQQHELRLLTCQHAWRWQPRSGWVLCNACTLCESTTPAQLLPERAYLSMRAHGRIRRPQQCAQRHGCRPPLVMCHRQQCFATPGKRRPLRGCPETWWWCLGFTQGKKERRTGMRTCRVGHGRRCCPPTGALHPPLLWHPPAGLSPAASCSTCRLRQSRTLSRGL